MVDSYNELYHSSIKTTPNSLYNEDDKEILKIRNEQVE